MTFEQRAPAAADRQDGFKPVYAPDGSRIVFAFGQFMCLMNADGSNVETLVQARGAYLNHFAWGIAAERLVSRATH